RTTETVTVPPDGVGSGGTTVVEVDGRRVEVRLERPEPGYRELARRRRRRGTAGGADGAADAGGGPMQGTGLGVRVRDGDAVQAGAVICVVEAMKRENEVAAHRDGVVSGLSVAAGLPVATGQVICVISADGRPAADD